MVVSERQVVQPPKCRIVIVDDHAPFREAVRILLSLHDDLQVIGEAADGREAIEMVENCRPDVILMDIRMPRMNGVEASSLITKSRSDAIIIGLCVVPDRYTVDAFMKAGAAAVISKDRLENLHSTIQQACKTKTGRAA
jgi:DNA-binding NarL/FixJ family response regulator